MEPVDAILKIAAGQGFPVLLLMLAIYWMQKSNNELVARLHAERAERLDKLEAMADACEKDRKELWNRLLDKNERK